jgi:hypothetical protein
MFFKRRALRSFFKFTIQIFLWYRLNIFLLWIRMIMVSWYPPGYLTTGIRTCNILYHYRTRTRLETVSANFLIWILTLVFREKVKFLCNKKMRIFCFHLHEVPRPSSKWTSVSKSFSDFSFCYGLVFTNPGLSRSQFRSKCWTGCSLLRAEGFSCSLDLFIEA